MTQSHSRCEDQEGKGISELKGLISNQNLGRLQSKFVRDSCFEKLYLYLARMVDYCFEWN